MSMQKPILGSSNCLTAAMAGKAQLAKDHANISGHEVNGPSLPQLLCEPCHWGWPMGVCRESLTLPPHWETVSLWKETSESSLQAIPQLPVLPQQHRNTCLMWAVGGSKAEGTGTALPGAAQVNSPLWISLQQHGLFRGHGRDKLNAWGASGWPSLPALLYFCFIIQPSLLLGSWSKIKAAGIQLDKTKNMPSPHMCATGIFVAVWSCLGPIFSLALLMSSTFAILSQLKSW